jgi:CheY-like chemotaxis protein
MEEDVQQSLNAGFDMHLIKPVQSGVLESAIEEVMGV